MKKNLLTLSAILATSLSFSQVVMSENFDGGTTLPAGWTQSNEDGLTPNSNLPISFGSNAWVVAQYSAGNNIAVSTSWYSSPGTSNDWLISPQIAVPNATGYECQFDVKASDPSYPDGFKVYISTTGNTVADFGTTPVLTVPAAPSAAFTMQSINLDAYQGQNIYVAIQNYSNDKYLLFLDNFKVRKPVNDDAILVSSTLNRYSLTNTNNTLGLTVKNDGANLITSITVDWNDGTSHSNVISTNIAPGATATINHPVPVSYATVVEENISVEITAVNSNSDGNPSNNTSANIINTVSQNSTKVVLIEEGTGTWCGYCPRGAVAMDYMDQNHPTTFAGVAVHNGDPMTVTAYDNGADFSGFPGANVDRVILGGDVSNNDFETYHNDRKDLIVPAGLDLTATINGNAITLNASATFRTPFNASNFRLGVIMSEDNVTGTGSGYNQTNYYANNALGAMGGFESLPDPVPAAQMVYNHVGRALLGGYDGQTGSVPAAITDGQVVNYTFNYTVPSTSVRGNMHATLVLIDQANGEVVNAKQIPLTQLSVAENTTINMEVYPNPASEAVNVKFDGKGGSYQVSLIDLTGRTVASSQVDANGVTSVAIPVKGLKAGSYLVSVANETGSFTQQVVVK
ncbi:MAG TPA: choice-of-anchor J domain-containing protein [Fluviicola sp.]|nr:choice-of-anchor J domain-containing protein [Fluviicola sp.]